MRDKYTHHALQPNLLFIDSKGELFLNMPDKRMVWLDAVNQAGVLRKLSQIYNEELRKLK